MNFVHCCTCSISAAGFISTFKYVVILHQVKNIFCTFSIFFTPGKIHTISLCHTTNKKIKEMMKLPLYAHGEEDFPSETMTGPNGIRPTTLRQQHDQNF